MTPMAGFDTDNGKYYCNVESSWDDYLSAQREFQYGKQ